MQKTLLFCTLLSSLTAFAGARGVGEGHVSNPLDAVCKLSYSDNSKPFCSGILTTHTSKKEAFLLTAGHCIHKEKFKNKLIRIDCGCDENFGCAETFYPFKAIYTDDDFKDHAMIELDHVPLRTRPVEIGDSNSLFKSIELVLGDEIQCLKGGFGTDETGRMTLKPKMFKVFSKLHLDEEPLGDTRIYTETKIKYNEVEKLAPDGLSFESRDSMIKKLVASGYIKNFNLVGDSGSGLFCKPSKNSSYKLFAIFVSFRDPKTKRYVSFQEDFNIFNANWLNEEKNTTVIAKP
jgi:hypothetical protein